MDVSTKSLNYKGSNIYYWTGGKAENDTLIFLHGWPGINLFGSGVLQELNKHFYLIAPNHPGLGRSEPLDTYTNIFEQYADLANHILDLEGRIEKVFVMGQSFGGGVAATFANKYRERIKELILIDSTVGAKMKSKWMFFLFNYGPKLLNILPFLPNPFKTITMKYIFAAKPDKLIKQRIDMVKNYTSIIGEAFKSNNAVINQEYGKFPILMVWGSRDGKEFNLYGSSNVDYAKELHKQMLRKGKNVRFLEVNGGHTILYEKPQYVIGEILKCLSNTVL